MAIKKYVANADNTITNAYEPDLDNRGTGSNMGASDVLDVFSISQVRNLGLMYSENLPYDYALFFIW